MIELLCGQNEFAIAHAVNERTAAYLKANDSIGLERINCDEADTPTIRSAILQLPFLVESKLVFLKNVFNSKVTQDLILDLLDAIPESIHCVIVDSKADKRTRLYKELQNRKSITEFRNLQGSELTRWAQEYCQSLKCEIQLADVEYLIERVGEDQNIISNELRKLSVFGNIDRQLIDTHTEQALKGTVFELLDYTFSGQIDLALELYSDLIANKVEPLEILGLIAWQIHVFSLVKFSGLDNAQEIAKLTGLHSFVVGKSLKVTKKMSKKTLQEIVNLALDADLKIKTTQVEPSDVVKVLILEFSSI